MKPDLEVVQIGRAESFKAWEHGYPFRTVRWHFHPEIEIHHVVSTGHETNIRSTTDIDTLQTAVSGAHQITNTSRSGEHARRDGAGGGQDENAARCAAGVVPRRRAKWCRRVSPLPKPQRPATASTGRSVCSSSSSARCSLCSSSHACGVAPVASPNRRTNVRTDIAGAAARGRITAPVLR